MYNVNPSIVKVDAVRVYIYLLSARVFFWLTLMLLELIIADFGETI